MKNIYNRERSKRDGINYAKTIRFNDLMRKINSLKSEVMRKKFTDRLFSGKCRDNRAFMYLVRRVDKYIEDGEPIPLTPEEKKARSLQRLNDYKAKHNKATKSNSKSTTTKTDIVDTLI